MLIFLAIKVSFRVARGGKNPTVILCWKSHCPEIDCNLIKVVTITPSLPLAEWYLLGVKINEA